MVMEHEAYKTNVYAQPSSYTFSLVSSVLTDHFHFYCQLRGCKDTGSGATVGIADVGVVYYCMYIANSLAH